MNSIDEEKKACRARILSFRDAQSRDDIIKKSKKIHDYLISMEEYRKSNKIMFFMGKEKEVQTEFMAEDALKKGKRVFIPITKVNERRLIPCEIFNLHELEISTFNVKEPKQEFQRPHDPKDIDLVIVPGVGFDVAGNRIGYGFGYYDSFLSEARQEIPFIGLAFEFQIQQEIPCDENDKYIDKIITDKRIIKCKNGNYGE
ncbi:MAG: 5-formyltetrahydrofolate cyclo-ligase [Candidatus Lokiarchaeota archaeon]|nr:5-formyltetrahydrofolate cyclo-ligase [Candidatus Lokiarchaeota archaeon]